MAEDSAPMGGISSDEIQELLGDEVAIPVNAGASAVSRFVHRIARLVALREAAGECEGFAFFLMSGRSGEHGELCTGNTHPLLANGNEPILGSVWISTAPVGDARKVNIAASEAGDAFDALRSGPLGELPTVLIDWQTSPPTGSLYPKGVSNAEQMSLIDLTGNEISPAEMKSALDRFYHEALRSPQQMTEAGGHRIWQQASRGVPEENPEKRIQGRVMDALRMQFARHNVRGEHNSKEGRVDILIWSHSSDAAGKPTVRHDWLLELKALKEKTSSGKTDTTSAKSAVQDGYDQAVRYRTTTAAIEAALCCFDLRKKDTGSKRLFSCIDKDASNSGIHLWRWFLYRSAKDLRSAIKSGELVEV